jgi:predicted Zn-dependent peptidase
MGYKRPNQQDKDDPVFDIVSEILSGGRTGLLYKSLVQDKQVALEVEAADTFPDGKYPNLFLFFVAPALGHTVEENRKALDEALDKFKTQQVDPQTLARVKTKARAGVIRRLDNNAGLASLLTANYAAYGDWRKLFTSLDDLDKVTAADVQRVARKYFVKPSETLAYTQAPAATGQGSAQSAGAGARQ